MKVVLITLMVFVATVSMALAQTTDTGDAAERAQASEQQSPWSSASERARLGNQRIQAEAEMRAREEQQRLEEAERARLEAEQVASESEGKRAPVSAPVMAAPESSDDIARTLEQLRSLGELKDDGYITDEEFRRIKQKILDDRI